MSLESPFQQVTLVTNDQCDAGGVQRVGRAKNVVDELPAREAVQDLGEGGFHPRPLAGGQDNHVKKTRRRHLTYFTSLPEHSVDLLSGPPGLVGDSRDGIPRGHPTKFCYLTKRFHYLGICQRRRGHG